MSLIVEIGSGDLTANSYVSRDDAYALLIRRGKSVTAWNLLLNGDPDAEEIALDGPDRIDACLIAARRFLDTALAWFGEPVKDGDDADLTAWPRYGAYNSKTQAYLNSNVVPAPLRYAQAEIANYIIQRGEDVSILFPASDGASGAGVKQVSIMGDLSITYAGSAASDSPGFTVIKSALSATTLRELRYLARLGNPITMA